MTFFPSTVWVTRAGIHLLNCPPFYFVFSHATWGVSQGKKNQSNSLPQIKHSAMDGLYRKRALIPVKPMAADFYPIQNMLLIGIGTQKPALIFVGYLHDHCQVQELSKDLLKWKLMAFENQGRFLGWRRASLGPSLFCGGHYVRQCPAAPQNKEGPLAVPFSYT